MPRDTPHLCIHANGIGHMCACTRTRDHGFLGMAVLKPEDDQVLFDLDWESEP